MTAKAEQFKLKDIAEKLGISRQRLSITLVKLCG